MDRVKLITLLACLSLTIFVPKFDALAFNSSPVVELSREELAELDKSGLVMRTFEQKDSSWPDVHIWAVIDAPSLTAAGLYYALDHQKNYVPNMLESTPVLQISPTEIHTQYELKMPWPLPNSRYINGSRLSSPGPELYKITWYKIENKDAKAIEGWAIFTPWKGNSSMVYYRNKVSPDGLFAGILKKIAPKNMQDTLKSIVSYIGNTAKSNPALAEKYENYILKALKGEFVYQAPIAPQKNKILK